MSFLEASEEEKEKLMSAEDSELVFGQPEEAEPEGGGGDGPADRHVDSKLQTPCTSETLQSRLISTDQYARRVADGAFGVGKGELVQAVGRAIGFKRIGPTIETRVRSVIEDMVQAGDLTRSGDHLTLSS